MTTNPRGRAFISYRRNHIDQIDRLSLEVNARGVPTWRDVESLRGEPTESAIRDALGSPDTAGAILWLTPEVVASDIVKHVEVPLAVERRKHDDGFWLIVVLAAGLNYDEVASILGPSLGTTNLAYWNLNKTPEPVATPEVIAGYAAQALEERIRAIANATKPEVLTRLTIGVDAKGTRSADRTTRDLCLDWTPYFNDGPPTLESWSSLEVVARDVGNAVKSQLAENGVVELDGTPSLPAATLLGAQFSVRDGMRMLWRQRNPHGTSIDGWSIAPDLTAEHARELGWTVRAEYQDASSTDLALCVNLSASTAGAIGQTPGLPETWRATVTVTPPSGRDLMDTPLVPEEAVSLVLAIVTELRRTRDSVHHVGSIHAFMAAPAGVAALLGTRIATLPLMVTYEFITATQNYREAVTIRS